MKAPGMLEKIDDAINPIVVKELRQAVNSRFVVAVVLLFLIIQVVYLGIHLSYVGLSGDLESVDYQLGRDIYLVLQIILLATCMLFLPAYTGARLAAERSEVNTDLLFITTLHPRKIISGKLVSAVLIALMIFSACAPFMAFTYFLRGIDLVTIFFWIVVDFLVVFGSVVLMVFFAVIPANRVLKAFLGVIGFAILVVIFGFTMGFTVSSVHFLGSPVAMPDFWSIAATVLVDYAGELGLIYTWSVALISAPSSNRALPVRLFMLSFAVVGGGIHGYICYATQREEPFLAWLLMMAQFVILCLWIAICERQSWTPRVTRTIPRNPVLRAPVFLVYSGAAGGVLFAGLLAGIATLGYWFFQGWFSHTVPGRLWSLTDSFFRWLGILVVYMYCYALTAVLVREWVLRTIRPGMTWILMLFLIALGSLMPFLISFLIHMGRWGYREHFESLIGNPAVVAVEMGAARFGEHQTTILTFAAVWASLVTLLNLPWFVRQMARFRPYDAASAVTVPVQFADGSSATLPVSS